MAAKTVIRVVKPFLFSYPLQSNQKVHREKPFAVGEHEVDDDVASHPWIRDHFADGCIERPEQTAARIAAAQEVAKKTADDAAHFLAHAEAAMKRTQAQAPAVKADAAQLEKDLNTPVSQLARQQGGGLDTPVGELNPLIPASPAADSETEEEKTGDESASGSGEESQDQPSKKAKNKK